LTWVLFDQTPREKIEKFSIFRGKFLKPKPEMAEPEQQKIHLTGSKSFDPDPSLVPIKIAMLKEQYFER